MSLNRMLLRCVAIEALTPQCYDTDQITLAGANVFDSRLDPIEFTDATVEMPTIIVYTDDDEAHLQNRSSNSGPYLRHCDLRIEIAIGSFEAVQIDEKTPGMAYGLPATDPELEARLDLFEQQVMWALRHWQGRAATAAFMAYVIRIETISSTAFRDESGNNKLALRRLHFKCVIPDDCPPGYSIGPSVPTAPTSASRAAPVAPLFTESDFGVTPWLKQMLVAIQSSPSMRAVVAALTGDTGRSFNQLTLFRRLGLNAFDISPGVDPSKLAKLNVIQGPDARLKYQSVWEINT